MALIMLLLHSKFNYTCHCKLASTITCGGRGYKLPHPFNCLQELLSVNHHLLNALGVGHSSLDKAFHIAHDNGLMCKTTGAGGGGCALVLVSPG